MYSHTCQKWKCILTTLKLKEGENLDVKTKEQLQYLGKSQAWLVNTSVYSISDLGNTVFCLFKRTMKLKLTKYTDSGSFKSYL